MPNNKWNWPLVAGVWVAYWLLFIIYLGNTRTPDYATGRTTEGEVIEVNDITIKAGRYRAKKKSPVVRYFVDSVEYKFYSIKESYLGMYEKGDHVTIIYEPGYPENSCILGLIGYWINITEIVTALFIILIITIFITVIPYGY